MVKRRPEGGKVAGRFLRRENQGRAKRREDASDLCANPVLAYSGADSMTRRPLDPGGLSRDNLHH